MIQYAGPLMFNSSFTKYRMPAFAGITTEASATGAPYELRGTGGHLRTGKSPPRAVDPQIVQRESRRGHLPLKQMK
jgi:hypothetical protein